MPTNPASPNSSAAVDRLTLGVESPRGTAQTAGLCVCQTGITCFEAEASGLVPCNPLCGCFEAEASAVLPCGVCFEVE